MRCPHCGRDNSEASSFCGGCGVPLGPKCTSCGHANRIDSRFCDNCGKPLNTSARFHKHQTNYLVHLASAAENENA